MPMSNKEKQAKWCQKQIEKGIHEHFREREKERRNKRSSLSKSALKAVREKDTRTPSAEAKSQAIS